MKKKVEKPQVLKISKQLLMLQQYRICDLYMQLTITFNKFSLFFGRLKYFRNIKIKVFYINTLKSFKWLNFKNKWHWLKNAFISNIICTKSELRFKNWQILCCIVAINVISFSHALKSIN